MILLTRFNGPAFALNPDLIERADHTPDTVITLVDGTKYVIAESLDELIQITRRHRAGVLADAELLINGHYREAGWPPAGRSFEEHAAAQSRGPVLEPVPHGDDRASAPGTSAGEARRSGRDAVIRPVEPAASPEDVRSAETHPSSLGPVPAPQSDVIPLHRKGHH